ncbi:MAG: M48 family metallopeptidase [Anaerolineales bacterium]|nr:M48 family metallopeptidase [Anaerolineales bacterium]
MNTTAYRYPNESLILTGALFLVFAVILLTSTATFCLSGIFILFFIGMSYLSIRSHHAELMRHGYRVTHQNAPRLAAILDEAAARLRVEPVEIYVVRSNTLNAYTFGLSAPKVIVINDSLLKVLDAEELQYVIGHEMGHVKLGHTWLNSIIGGLAGIPSPYLAFAVLHLAFRSWNRACEFSADRAGILANNDPRKAITALIKIGTGGRARTEAELQHAYAALDAQDDTLAGNLGELLGTHPLIIKRIEKIREYAQSRQYQDLRVKMG